MEHYNTLGVAQGASESEIKSAFRKLASQHHPDKGGDTAAFQRIQTAYSILSDTEKRSQYDNSLRQPNPFQNNPFQNNPFHNDPFQDLINQFTRHHQAQRIYTVTVFLTLEQIARGQNENIQVNTPHGPKMFSIQIPPAVEDGGQFSFSGIMPDGPVSITFRIHAHNKFTRQGLDLHCTEAINMFDLILGATLKTTDILGNELHLTIPSMSKPNTKMRIKGRGLTINGSAGDQYVLLNPVIPDRISESLLSEIKKEFQ